MKQKVFSFIVLATMLLVLPLSVLAEVKVQATVDRNELGQEDTLIVKVSIISEESVEVTEPRFPELEGFDLINSWQGRTNSTQLVQGPRGMEFESTTRTDFNYMLAPKKKGKLAIGGFEVVVDGKSYRTKPITVAVNETSGKSQNIAENSDEDEDVFSQLLRRGGLSQGYTSSPPDSKNAFFIQVELDKTEAYEGEQVLASWYIYTRGAIEQIDRLKFPNLKGFWKEDIEASPNLNFTQEIVNGMPYKKALLASYALFPIKQGTAVVDEYKIKSVVRLPTSGFGAFGFGRPFTYTRSSENVKLKIKPLPVEGRPKDFSGAVGQFTVDGKIEGEKFTVNQPFSFKVRFEGQGNAKLIDLPPLDLPPNLEMYDVKNESKFFKSGRSYKEFEILLIPREPGQVTIPAVSVSMFDPVNHSYVTKSTQPVSLEIQPGQTGDAIGSQRLADKGQPAKAEKARSLPEPIVDWHRGRRDLKIPATPTWALAFMAVFGVLGWKARREFQWGAKKRNLKSEVKRRFKKVYSHIDEGQWRKAAVEVTNIVYHTFGEVAGSGGANLEMEKLILKAPPSVRRSLEPQLSQLVDQFQALSFAPEEVLGESKEKAKMKASAHEMEVLLMKAAGLIEEKDQKS